MYCLSPEILGSNEYSPNELLWNALFKRRLHLSLGQCCPIQLVFIVIVSVFIVKSDVEQPIE